MQDDELPALAMKVMRKDDIANRKWWQQERNILAVCDSPFVTRLHFAFQNQTHLFLVTDPGVCGNLR